MEAVMVYLRYKSSSCLQVPRKGAKLFTSFLIKNRTLDLPNRSRIPQLSVSTLCGRSCVFVSNRSEGAVKKPNLIYMKAESAQQRWSSISCSLSMIGSHAVGKMKEKRSTQKSTKLVQPRLHLVGNG